MGSLFDFRAAGFVLIGCAAKPTKPAPHGSRQATSGSISVPPILDETIVVNPEGLIRSRAVHQKGMNG